MVFEQVCADLEDAGYEVQPYLIPACAVDAPHRRDRVWFVAHRKDVADSGNAGPEILQREGAIGVFENGVAANAQSAGRTARAIRQREIEPRGDNSGAIRRRFFDGFPTQSPVCSRNDGVSEWLDGITFPRWRRESIKAYGNAIVPQVVLQIFETINEYERSYERSNEND